MVEDSEKAVVGLSFIFSGELNAWYDKIRSTLLYYMLKCYYTYLKLLISKYEISNKLQLYSDRYWRLGVGFTHLVRLTR